MAAFTHPDDALRQNVEAGQDAALQKGAEHSEEVRQQYEAEKAHVNALRAQRAEVAQTGLELNRAVETNRALTQYEQATMRAVETAHRAFSNPDGTIRPDRGIDYLSEDTSLENHRQIIKSLEEFQIAQEKAAPYSSDIAAELAAQQEIASQTPQQREPVEYRDNGDGTRTVKLETGETFRGTEREVILKLGKAKIESRRHYEAKQAELNARQQQPANGQPQQQPPTNGELQQPATTPIDSDVWIREKFATSVGYANADEMMKEYRTTQEMLQEYRNQGIASTFLARNEDFPNSQEAIAALTKILETNGWEENADTLTNAHAIAVKQGMYRPLSTEEIRATNQGYQQPPRPTPPPMIRSGSPDAARPTENLWEIPLDQLRKQALAQGKS